MQLTKAQPLTQQYLAKQAQQRLFTQLLDALIAGLKNQQDISPLWQKLQQLSAFCQLSQMPLFIDACKYLASATPQPSLLLIQYLIWLQKLINSQPLQLEQQLKKQQSQRNFTYAPELCLSELPDISVRTHNLKNLSPSQFLSAKSFIQQSLAANPFAPLNASVSCLFARIQQIDHEDIPQIYQCTNAFLFFAQSKKKITQEQLKNLAQTPLFYFLILLKQAASFLGLAQTQNYIHCLFTLLDKPQKTEDTTEQHAQIEPELDKDFNLKQIFSFELESLQVSFQRFQKITDSTIAAQQKTDILRAAHSIKGSAAIAGFSELSSIFSQVENYLAHQSITSNDVLQQVQQLNQLIVQYLSTYIASDNAEKIQQQQQEIYHWLKDKQQNNQQQKWHEQLKNWLCLTENDCLLDDPQHLDANLKQIYNAKINELFDLFKHRYYPEFEYFLALYHNHLSADSQETQILALFYNNLEINLNQLMAGDSPSIASTTLEQLEQTSPMQGSEDERFFYQTCSELLIEIQQSLKQNPQVPLFSWLKKEIKNLIQAANHLHLYSFSGFFFNLLSIIIESPKQTVSNLEQANSLLKKSQLLLHRRQYYPQYSTQSILQQIEYIKKNIAYKPREKSEFAEEISDIFQQEANVLLQGIKVQINKWSANPKSNNFAHAILRLLHTLKGSAKLVDASAIAKCAHQFEDLLTNTETHELKHIHHQYQQLKNILNKPHTDKIATGSHKLKPKLPNVYKGELSLSRQELDKQLILASENIIMRDRIERQMRSVSAVIEEFDRTLERLLEQTKQLEQESAATAACEHKNHTTNSDNHEDLELESYSSLQNISQVISESVSDIKDIRHSIVRRNLLTHRFLDSQRKINMSLQQSLLSSRQIEFSQILPRLQATCEKNSRELNKPAQLYINNQQLKIDQALLEQLVTPLEHIIRNALDHGIENAQQRQQQHKPETASIYIQVNKTTSEYQIDISDDGMGIDFNKIRQKALDKGLINQQQALTEKQCLQLIFSPGFSTASKVTDISGRGFGLDIVDYEIKKMGGQIEVLANAQQGASFRIHLPFSLSQNKALFIQQNNQRFAIPFGHIKATLRHTNELKIEHEKLHYLGQKYPIINLSQLLHLKHHSELSEQQPALLLINSLIPTAIVVDKLLAFREIVVKSLGQSFSGFSPVVGGSVLADGQIVPVLDLPALILQQAQGIQPHTLLSTPTTNEPQAPLILIVDDSVTVRKYSSRMLMSHGYRTLRARDGLEAIEKMQKHTPDLVLLDIEMPNMDGFEVASLMKHDTKLKTIPIIMISSRSGKKYQQKAQSMGVQHFLNKPYNKQELLALIKTL